MNNSAHHSDGRIDLLLRNVWHLTRHMRTSLLEQLWVGQARDVNSIDCALGSRHSHAKRNSMQLPPRFQVSRESAACLGDLCVLGITMCTSAFLRQLSAVGIVRVPTTLSTPNPGFFGPAWNESAEQATSVHDLFDYMGCAVPAWLFFAHYELRTGPGKDQQIKIPDLHMDTLMPFWKLLQNAMDRNRVTVALAIAVQAALLSVIRVNGQKRCIHARSGDGTCWLCQGIEEHTGSHRAACWRHFKEHGGGKTKPEAHGVVAQ